MPVKHSQAPAHYFCICQCLQGIQAVYTPFANMVQTADPATAAIVDDALAAGLASVSPYIPYIGSSEAPLPYSFITVQQRAPIQAAGYTISSALRQARQSLRICLRCNTSQSSVRSILLKCSTWFLLR